MVDFTYQNSIGGWHSPERNVKREDRPLEANHEQAVLAVNAHLAGVFTRILNL